MPVFFIQSLFADWRKNKMVNVRKRGKAYEYSFDVAKIEGKRKRISKSGFKTKAEALKQGTIAYNEYLNNRSI